MLCFVAFRWRRSVSVSLEPFPIIRYLISDPARRVIAIDKGLFSCFNQLMTDQAQTVEPKTEAKSGPKQALTAVLILLGIIGLFLLAKYAIPRALVYLTRAARSTEISLTNSYVFGSPLVAAADGQTKIRVNVFLLNDQGLGVADKRVSLLVKPKTAEVAGNAQLKEVQPTTDKFGQAVFEVASSFPGQFVATASVEGVELPQTVTLTFR